MSYKEHEIRLHAFLASKLDDAFLVHVREVLVSNLDPETCYPD
jgi:hypothetical protein